jgi:predicted transposase/invertase (TIGR01784 family)
MTDNPHDALFQYTFAKVEHAAPALRTMLPAALAAQIDFATLRLVPGAFVDPELDGHRTDLLFSATIAGRPAFVYVLFEHQSYEDRLLLLRMLEYMVRIWRAYLDEHPRAKRLPPIVPLVLHHSKKGWRAARRFEELLDIHEATRKVVEAFVPRFEIVLDDISTADDGELQERAMTALGRLVLYLFRHARTPEELFGGLGRWTEVLREVLDAPDGGAAIGAVLEYLRSVTKLDKAEVIMAVRETVGESVRDRILYAGERLVQQGRQEGRRDLLLRQLRLRFGELPASAQERVNAASSEELDAMAERILTVETLAEVVGVQVERSQPPPKSGRRRGRRT